MTHLSAVPTPHPAPKARSESVQTDTPMSRHQKMAARMAVLHDLLHDPTVPITTLDILSGRAFDADRTVGLRLVRPPGAEPEPGHSGQPASLAPDSEEAAASDGLDIDPRLRARRISVQRAAGRRRLRWVAAVCGLLGAAVVAWVVSRTPLLDVDRVAVVGLERTSEADVVDAAAIPSGQALLDVDLSAVAARIDDLPWVAAVEVERHWPGTVVVRVEERRPVAVAALDEGEWAVLSADGRLMDVAPEPPPGLIPLVDVPPVTEGARLEPATVDALAVARLVPDSLAARVVGVGPSTKGGVEIRLDAGVIRIGTAVDLVNKLVAADAVLAQAPAHCVEVIDVEVPEVPVLTLRPECG